jgi:hypothetical protein
MTGCIRMYHLNLQQWELEHLEQLVEDLMGELDLFRAPPSMNLADERSPKAGSGAGAAKDEDN